MSGTMGCSSYADYYFVPLGRERGSYLDILGLPSNATETEAAERENHYRNRIDAESRNRRRRLKVQLDYQALAHKVSSGEMDASAFEGGLEELRSKFVNVKQLDAKLNRGVIDQDGYDAELRRLEGEFESVKIEAERHPLTSEEYEAHIKELEQQNNDRESQLNQLRSVFQATLAQRRALARSGMVDTSVPWRDLYQTYRAPELFRRLVLGPSPISAEPYSDWSPKSGSPTSLPELRELVRQHRISVLSCADLLWDAEQRPGRGLWHAKIDWWIEELLRQELPLQSAAEVRQLAEEPEYPTLCRPTQVMMDHLDIDDSAESERPSWGEEYAAPLDIHALLAALFGERTLDGGALDDNTDHRSDLDRLREEFFEQLLMEQFLEVKQDDEE